MVTLLGSRLQAMAISAEASWGRPMRIRGLRQIVVDLGASGAQVSAALEVRNRIRELPRFAQDHAQVDQGIDVLGIGGQRLLKLDRRLFRPAELHQPDTLIAQAL